MVDKSTLKPHSVTWDKSSSISIKAPDETGEFQFMGFETKNSVDVDKKSLICSKKTGKGVFKVYLKKFDISTINIPDLKKNEITQPWNNQEIIVVKHNAISKKMKSVLEQKVNGLQDSFEDVISFIHSKGIPVFIVGGCIRDLIQDVKNKTNTTIKDIDIGFGCSANELVQILKPKYTKVTVSPTGLVRIGDVKKDQLYLEGKSLNGFNNDRYKIKSSKSEIPSSIGTDLRNENYCRDFTCNALWYDIINHTIIDPSGYGIEDTLNQKLRIPVSNWKCWLDGNPTKLMRFMKMKGKGYSAIDKKTEDFIIKGFSDQSITKIDTKIQYRYVADAEKPIVKSLIIQHLGQTFWDSNF